MSVFNVSLGRVFRRARALRMRRDSRHRAVKVRGALPIALRERKLEPLPGWPPATWIIVRNGNSSGQRAQRIFLFRPIRLADWLIVPGLVTCRGVTQSRVNFKEALGANVPERGLLC